MWLHVMHLYITEHFKWFEMKIKNQNTDIWLIDGIVVLNFYIN